MSEPIQPTSTLPTTIMPTPGKTNDEKTNNGFVDDSTSRVIFGIAFSSIGLINMGLGCYLAFFPDLHHHHYQLCISTDPSIPPNPSKCFSKLPWAITFIMAFSCWIGAIHSFDIAMDCFEKAKA